MEPKPSKKKAKKKAVKKVRKPRKKKEKKPYYINPAEFLADITEYYRTDDLVEKLGEDIVKIATGLGFAPNFINYSYKDDMIGDAVLKMLTALRNKKFNIDSGNNPFSYFTTIAYPPNSWEGQTKDRSWNCYYGASGDAMRKTATRVGYTLLAHLPHGHDLFFMRRLLGFGRRAAQAARIRKKKRERRKIRDAGTCSSEEGVVVGEN